MLYIFALIVALVPALFGAYMIFMPIERLVASVAWMRLPMPKEGSGAYSLLRIFWRSIGVVAWLFAAFVIFMIIFRRE